MFVAEFHVVCSCVGADLRFGSPNTEKCEGKHAYKPPRCNQQTVSRCIFSVSSTHINTAATPLLQNAHTHTHTHRISSFSVQPSLSSAASENDFIGMTSVPLPPYFCHPGPQPASKRSVQPHRSSSFFASSSIPVCPI